MTDQKYFTAADVKKILGVDKGTLFYWIHTHRLLVPAVPAKGTGTRVKFSKANMLEISIIKSLLKIGFTLTAIEALMGQQEVRKPS